MQPAKPRILIPILGMRCEYKDFTIGRLSFTHLDRTALDTIRNEFLDSMPVEARSSDTVQEVADNLDQQLEAVRGATAMIFEGDGLHPEIRDEAFSEALNALAFLRFYAAFVFSELQDPVIDYWGNFGYDFRNPYHIATGGASLFTGMMRFPNSDVLVISEESVAHMYALGIDRLLKILEPRARRTKFDCLTLDAIGWFSSASMPTRLENRLLNYITCLEMFLSAHDAPVTQNVSEGAALVISDDPSVRQSIAETIKNYYGRRNKISHGGASVRSIADVLALKSICATFLLRVLARAPFFSTRDQFRHYIRQIRLSGKAPF